MSKEELRSVTMPTSLSYFRCLRHQCDNAFSLKFTFTRQIKKGFDNSLIRVSAFGKQLTLLLVMLLKTVLSQSFLELDSIFFHITT